MIFVRLHGRMGNQLFQYATARGLATKAGAQVILDERTLAHKGQRSARDLFHWNVTSAGHLPPFRHEAPLRYAAWRKFGRNPRFLRESPGIETRLLDAGDNIYLHGYWQRPHYFAHIEDDLRQELAFKPAPSEENQRLADKIQSHVSLSVHVRRGDFVGLGLAQKYSPEYFRAAVDKAAEHIGASPHLYVFSDDPEWARAHLSFPYLSTIVDINDGDTDYEDLRLISLCDHNVICGSSFSWWGAWLNDNPGKVVVGPGDPSDKHIETKPSDWLPAGWLRVSPEQ